MNNIQIFLSLYYNKFIFVLKYGLINSYSGAWFHDFMYECDYSYIF